MTIGERLKELRVNNNLTQQELAEKLYVSDKTISSWECDRTIPEISMLFKISNLYNINFYSLIDSNYCNDIPVEIELKVRLNNNEYNRLFNEISKLGTSIKKVNHIDTYYMPNYRDFNNEWLRIRKEDNKYILTYKKKVIDKCCEEYESLFDNYKNLEEILKHLGFTEKGKITKERTKILYRNKYEFAFDKVDNIGNFLEIEVKKIDSDKLKEIKELFNLLNEFDIDLNQIEQRRYSDLI